MVALASNSSAGVSFDILRTALPIGIGIASIAYLTAKVAVGISDGLDKRIPTASFRPGDSTHDSEYQEDQDAFVKRCEAECGSIFNIRLQNRPLTVISSPQIREVFMNEDFNSMDAVDEFTGMRSFFNSLRKSNHNDDNRIAHELVRDTISPNLPLFTPRLVQQLERSLERELEKCPSTSGGIFVEDPMAILKEVIAGAMVTVFMGPEFTDSRRIIDTFITATADFGKMIASGTRRASLWRSLLDLTHYHVIKPLQVHVQALTEATTPVILDRRRQEAEAVEKGLEWKRPDDILQRLLDNFDKYGFVDHEDVCGHLLILVLASVHGTADTSANLLYYMAAFPQHMDTLYTEQQDVMDAIRQEREQKRQECLRKGEPISEELEPSRDRDLTSNAIRRMVHMDSFVREVFRYRTERLTLMHRARKDVTLSNGKTISKGNIVIMNLLSAHYGSDQGEDVSEFRPWRFVGKSKAASKAGADFLPFGMGKHGCPGRFLAIQELKTFGIMMVARYSRIEMQDPSKTMQILRSRIGEPMLTGLTLTSRA
ncbi:hypothetical protein BGZ98_002054 [Dissophora globulifera]|nr:hypothetical protein BGZ98_002054 [Dissophora globulifera]